MAGSSSSSRLVTGNYSVINEVEQAFAEYFGYEDCVFFSSGYQANLGLLSALFEAKDTVFFDKHIHASSVKGLNLSGATIRGFKHNSMAHLAKRIQTHQGPVSAVVTEALYSMDGDYLDLQPLVDLKTKHEFLTIVDEAHTFGVAGPQGRGIAGEIADIAVGTFGKALGLFGAFVLLPKVVKEYLFNFCSPLIYSTCLPEAHAAAALQVLEAVKSADQAREHLQFLCKIMKKQLQKEGFHVYGDEQIIAIEIGDEQKALTLSQQLLKKKIFLFPARFPTVPLGKAILRLSLTAQHQLEDVYYFILIF